MRTSALFGSKNFKFFEIYCVSAQTGGGVELVRTICGQGWKGSIFRDFVFGVLYGRDGLIAIAE